MKVISEYVLGKQACYRILIKKYEMWFSFWNCLLLIAFMLRANFMDILAPMCESIQSLFSSEITYFVGLINIFRLHAQILLD
jgi:hypothetical protein